MYDETGFPLYCRPALTVFLTDRTKRVKDAKSEAQKEIDEYRKKKEEEFKKYESEVCNLKSFSPCSLTYSNSKKAETRKPRKTPIKMQNPDSRI